MPYRNSDLEFLNKPRVKSANGVPGHEGEHYVAGTALLMQTGEPNTFYLLSDGLWYTSATNGKTIGYFSSVAEAERMLASVHPTLKQHTTFETNLDWMEVVRRFKAGVYRSA